MGVAAFRVAGLNVRPAGTSYWQMPEPTSHDAILVGYDAASKQTSTWNESLPRILDILIKHFSKDALLTQTEHQAKIDIKFLDWIIECGNK